MLRMKVKSLRNINSSRRVEEDHQGREELRQCRVNDAKVLNIICVCVTCGMRVIISGYFAINVNDLREESISLIGLNTLLIIDNVTIRNDILDMTTAISF